MTILFTGDLLLDRGVRYEIEHNNPITPFEKIKPLLAGADYTIANLECPVTKIVSPLNKRFVFRGEPEWLAAVKNAGITHLVMSNNHSTDQGRSGVVDTWKNIDSFKLKAVGFGDNQQAACQPVIVEKNGIKLGLFASVLLPLENWSYLPDSAGICQATPAELAMNIQQFKQQFPQAYAVIVLHWGVEYQPSPTISQRQWARQLIDAGADAVIGHHPHVIQDVEVYKGKTIFYSLGNFVFDQKAPGDKALIAELYFQNGQMHVAKHKIKIEHCIPQEM